MPGPWLPLFTLVPLGGAVVALALRSKTGRAGLLVATALVHLGLVASLFAPGVAPPRPALGGHLALDPLGLLVLSVASLVFAATAIYNVRYRRLTPPRLSRVYMPANLVLLAAMSVLCTARHLGVLWVASGATTLATALVVPLHRGRHALEATWKFIMLCSVGVAFALLGIFFVGIAATDPAGTSAASGLLLDDLLATARAGRLSAPWLRTAFVFLLVGYGTKVGLAPLHSWKPDTYAEAPTPISALLATGLTACAFLNLLRGYQVLVAAGEGAFGGQLLVVLGLFSIAVGAAFVVGQGDLKRLLAYSGVEHMGIVALGVGLGGTAAYGAMLHLVGHSIAKGVLFLAAGNAILACGTRAVGDLSGLMRRLPATGVLLLAGFLATLGFPPSAIFLSELTILRGAIEAGLHGIAGAFVGLLSIVFVAVAAAAVRIVQGRSAKVEAADPESSLLTLPAFALLALVVALGVHIPAALHRALAGAAALVGG